MSTDPALPVPDVLHRAIADRMQTGHPALMQIDRLVVVPTGRGHHAVMRRATGTHAPFHLGIVVGRSVGMPDAAIAHDVAGNLVWLHDRHVDAVEMLRRTIDEISRRAADAGVPTPRTTPAAISTLATTAGRPKVALTCRVDVEMVEDDLVVRTSRRFATNRSGRVHAAQLLRDLRAQPDRRRRAGMEWRIDRVTMDAIGRPGDRQRAEMRRVLADRRGAHAPGDDRSAASLREAGLRLPACVETLALRSGRISGRVRLAPSITWRDGTLRIAGARHPDAVVAAMAGRRLAEVITHPSLPPDAAITSAVASGNGMLTLHVEVEDVEFTPGDPT